MAVAREIVGQADAKSRGNLRRPFNLAVGAVGLAVLLVWIASQRTTAHGTSASEEQPPEQLKPASAGAAELLEMALAEDRRRAREGAGTSLPAAGDRLPVMEDKGPKVHELMGGGTEAEAWAEAAAANESTSPAAHLRTRQEELERQYEERLRQRELQALEESRFPKSLRVEAFEQGGGGGGGAGIGAGEDTSERDEVPMQGLTSLQNALLEQSADQIRSGGPSAGALEALRGLAVPGIGTSEDSSRARSAQAERGQFFRRGGEQLQPGVLMAAVTKPLSPYQLNMGAVIRGVLISKIHSESPGQILGQVSENVYDSATGDHLLIPQGTKIVGPYSGAISLGQERVQVAAVRLNFRDASTLDLGGMSIADATGQAGLSDRVNNHFWKKVGAAFLSTSAVVGYEMTAPQTMFGPEGAVHRALGESILKMANDMAQRNADIPPTLEVRPGQSFVIHVNKDIVFPGSYEDGDPHRVRDLRDGGRRGAARSVGSGNRRRLELR